MYICNCSFIFSVKKKKRTKTKTTALQTGPTTEQGWRRWIPAHSSPNNEDKMLITKLPECTWLKLIAQLSVLIFKNGYLSKWLRQNIWVYLPAAVSEACLLPAVWFLTFLAQPGVHILLWLAAQNPVAPVELVHALLATPSLLSEA